MKGLDWEWALVHLDADLRRQYGEDFLLRGVAHPISHTLDLAFAYRCSAVIARKLRDQPLAAQFETLAQRWVNAYDPATGLLQGLRLLRGRQMELFVPADARHAAPDRVGRR